MKKTKSIVMAAAMIAGSSEATAAPISDLLEPGFNLLSDNSAEILINSDGSFSNTDSIVEIGDRLRGIFDIGTIENSGGIQTAIGGGTANNELAGIFDVTVVNILGAAPTLTFVFEPTPVGTSGFDAFGAPAGTAVVFFEDATAEYTRQTLAGVCTSSAPGADCESNINDGDEYWFLGFKAVLDPGDTQFWVANDVDTDDISEIGATPVPGNAGGFNVSLFDTDPGRLATSGVQLGLNACGVDAAAGQSNLCASGSLLGTNSAAAGNPGTPYDSFDDVNFAINQQNDVPEPMSTSLMAIGLLGMAGFVGRRRRTIA